MLTNCAPLASALSRWAGVVGPGLDGVGVGASADQEAVTDELLNAVKFFDRVVDIEPGGRRVRRGDRGEHHTVIECLVFIEVPLAQQRFRFRART